MLVGVSCHPLALMLRSRCAGPSRETQNLQCWARWNNYVECFRDAGTCDSCAEEYLPEWEACIEMVGSPK